MLGEELAGLCARGIVFSVPVAINENGVGSALNAGRVLGCGGHVRPRAFPERFADARAGGDGDEVGVVQGAGKSEGEVGFLDLGGGRKVANKNAMAVGEEFQPIGPNPGRPQDARVNFHFLVQTSGDIAGTVSAIHLHVDEQTHADVGAHVPETLAGFGDVNFIRMSVGAFHIGAGLAEDEAADIMGVTGAHSSDGVPPIEHRKPVTIGCHKIGLHRG